jgi:hypothetical protein
LKEVKFENYTKMIDKKAWEVARKTGVDFEELQAYGALIYCNILEKYDVSKSSFSTILYLGLNRLYEYAYYDKDGNYTAKTNNGKSVIQFSPLTELAEKSIQSMEVSPTMKDLLELAKEKLEDDSYRLIEWLVNRTWEFQGRIKPCITMAMRQFGWDRKYSKAVWEKCRAFWNESGWKLYC